MGSGYAGARERRRGYAGAQAEIPDAPAALGA